MRDDDFREIRGQGFRIQSLLQPEQLTAESLFQRREEDAALLRNLRFLEQLLRHPVPFGGCYEQIRWLRISSGSCCYGLVRVRTYRAEPFQRELRLFFSRNPDQFRVLWQAAGRLFRFFFSQPGLSVLSSFADHEDPWLCHFLEQLGFSSGGTLREHALLDGVWRDEVCFTLLKGELPSEIPETKHQPAYQRHEEQIKEAHKDVIS